MSSPTVWRDELPLRVLPGVDGGAGSSLQLAAVGAAGVDSAHVVVEYASGAAPDRPKFAALLTELRPGDTLVVWRLDRLGRSLPHLIETVTGLGSGALGLCR